MATPEVLPLLSAKYSAATAVHNAAPSLVLLPLHTDGTPSVLNHFAEQMEAKDEQSQGISQQGSALLGCIFCSPSLLLLALAIFLHKFPKSDKGNLLCVHKALGISWRHIIPAIILLIRGAVVLVKFARFLPCKEKRGCWGFFINHSYAESCSSRLHSDHF